MALPTTGDITLLQIQAEFPIDGPGLTGGLAGSASTQVGGAGLATLSGTNLTPDISMRDFLGLSRISYVYSRLTNSGIYTVPAWMTRMTVVVVGGGGGGGGKQVMSRRWDGGGGGGAGGVVAAFNVSVSPGMTYAYVVGGGGTGYAQYGQGNDGSGSLFYSDVTSTTLNLYAYGGGGGGGSFADNGRSGGSGGGGSSYFATGRGGSATNNQGFSGGTGEGNSGFNGGGGGAGGPGNSTRYELSALPYTSGGRGIGTYLGNTTGNPSWTNTLYMAVAGGGGAGGGFDSNGQERRFAAYGYGGGDGGYARNYAVSSSLSNGYSGLEFTGGGGGGGGGNVDEYYTSGGNGGSGVIYVLAHNYEGGWSNPWAARGTPSGSYCWPAYGTGLYALFNGYADGWGGTGDGLVEALSVTCGYVPYTPPGDGTTGDG